MVEILIFCISDKILVYSASTFTHSIKYSKKSNTGCKGIGTNGDSTGDEFGDDDGDIFPSIIVVGF